MKHNKPYLTTIDLTYKITPGSVLRVTNKEEGKQHVGIVAIVSEDAWNRTKVMWSNGKTTHYLYGDEEVMWLNEVAK